MAKKRIYEIAKQHGLSSKELLEKLTAAGISAKTASSSVEEADALKVISPAQTKDQTVTETPERPTSQANGKPEAVDISTTPKVNQAQPSTNRPTRSPLAGERAASAGGRRRVVIDSQASRRPAGAPAPAASTQAPPGRRGGQRRGKRRRDVFEEPPEVTQPVAEEPRGGAIKVNSGSTVKDIAQYFEASVPEIIKRLMQLGEMATVTKTLSDEAVELLAEELGKSVEIVHTDEEDQSEVQAIDQAADLKERPPVITVMGHVDHGKTSLLDAIRKTQVVAGEAGGITQHIGAYQVSHGEKTVTFLDTPGHEAFTAMRARGARVTDIAVIVVAADDGVKPQTEEAIDHARAAGVPILVAVNKIDKPEAQPELIRTQLTQHDLQPEEWGGQTIFVDVSAKSGQGLDQLLDMLSLVAEVEELKANPNAQASGVVIESKLDPGRGPVVTMLVQRGTLKVGDALVAGANSGRVRAMYDFRGKRLKQAQPSVPVEILGFDSVPEAGELIRVVDNDRVARQLAGERARRLKSEALARSGPRKVTLEDVLERAREGEVKALNLVLKADVSGSVEAVEDEIARLPQDEVSVNVIHRGVGGINASDVMLAAASNAVVLGFNVRPIQDAAAMADREQVEIRTYAVIYKAIDDLRAAMTGLLEPEEVETTLGRADVREVFKASKFGQIAGCYVTEGKITRGSKVRLIRDGAVVYDGEIASLRRFKDDVREVATNYECGIVLKDFMDVKARDELEVYETTQVERELV